MNTWTGPSPSIPAPPETAPPPDLVRAWLRRPGALRLETADGLVLQSTTGINDSRDVFYVRSTRKTWLLPPHLVTPVYDDRGLVRRRPEAAYGEPGFGNGRFAAALDPVELAGNAPVPLEFPNANAVELGSHHRSDARGPPRPGGHRHPEPRLPPQPPRRAAVPAGPHAGEGRRRHGRLRRQPLAGGRPGRAGARNGTGPDAYGHWIRILGVDEYMLDDLFLAESMNLTDVRRHISWELPAG